MIVGPPGLPTANQSEPSLRRTNVGVIAESGRLRGATALRSPCMSPNMFGVPGFAAKSSISSFIRRSEEHTSELQSRQYLVCRLLLEKKKKNTNNDHQP